MSPSITFATVNAWAAVSAGSTTPAVVVVANTVVVVEVVVDGDVVVDGRRYSDVGVGSLDEDRPAAVNADVTVADIVTIASDATTTPVTNCALPDKLRKPAAGPP